MRASANLRRLLVDYWKTPEGNVSALLLLLIIGVILSSTYLHVAANELLGRLTDVLVNKQWSDLPKTMLKGLTLGVLIGLIGVLNVALVEVVELRWRSWLTHDLIERWTESSKFYQVERDQSISNIDQRISEDVRILIDSTLNIGTSVVSAVANIVTFTALLWTLSQSIEIEVFGHVFEVRGYMTYLCYLWAFVGLALTHLCGRALIPITVLKQDAEANFRYSATQLRDNAEQVALYGGGKIERRRLRLRFTNVREVLRRSIFVTWRVNSIRSAYEHVFEPLGLVSALPLYFAGKLTYGGLMRVSAVFGTLKASLSFFSQAYVGFTTLAAVYRRLSELLQSLDDSVHQQHKTVQIVEVSNLEVSGSNLIVKSVRGTVLCTVPDFVMNSGDRLLITGVSGAGKSTLLRMLSGLWPHGSGTVSRPSSDRVLFVPQKPYVPSGPLADVLVYPGLRANIEGDVLVSVLIDVGLPELAAELEASADWARRLSGGEQQRLAFARILLLRPEVIFLDESTSALDVEAEQYLYRLIINRLPDSVIVSIAHRESIRHFHGRFLHIDGTRSIIG